MTRIEAIDGVAEVLTPEFGNDFEILKGVPTGALEAGKIYVDISESVYSSEVTEFKIVIGAILRPGVTAIAAAEFFDALDAMLESGHSTMNLSISKIECTKSTGSRNSTIEAVAEISTVAKSHSQEDMPRL